jgi:hypothetical protein
MAQVVKEPQTARSTRPAVTPAHGALRLPPRTEREQTREETLRRLRAARAAFARMHRSP